MVSYGISTRHSDRLNSMVECHDMPWFIATGLLPERLGQTVTQANSISKFCLLKFESLWSASFGSDDLSINFYIDQNDHSDFQFLLNIVYSLFMPQVSQLARKQSQNQMFTKDIQYNIITSTLDLKNKNDRLSNWEGTL